MSEKNTKRAVDELNIEDYINQKRSILIDERTRAPELLNRASFIREEASNLTKRWQCRMRNDKIASAEVLEKRYAYLCSMTAEHNFESSVATYLRTYHSPSLTHCDKKRQKTSKNLISAVDFVNERRINRESKSAIAEEYLLDICDGKAKVAMAMRDVCPTCEIRLLLCTRRSIMTCPECGHCITYLDATSASTSFDDVIEYSQYSYKRVNHYMMWIILLQGKESHRVPDDIINGVMSDLYSRLGIRIPSDVTQKKVRQSLRYLKYRKAYDHVSQVTSRISGIRPPRINAEVEEQLKTMFLKMQPAFQRHAPKSRTNFLSYSYVLYRCFQILGLPHMLEGLTLLKGRDKLEANDVIFRKMSEDLKWPTFKLPPNGVLQD